MRKVYLDNAATTAIRPEVIDIMVKVMTEDYGNPSSSHSFGRHAKSQLELSRKSIAKSLNCHASEIIFTSGGTEADNWILRAAVRDLGVKRFITSKIEHHAILHAADSISDEFGIAVDYVKVLPNGSIDVNHLESLLSDDIPTLVTLMHVNNEIGTVLDLQHTGNLCRKYKAYFHSDTIQSVGKERFDMQELPIDFIVASAHKFHGPKGIGFAFLRKGVLLNPMFFGGEQEKGLRAGTEAIHNVVGMAKALEIAYDRLDHEKQYVSELKAYCAESFKARFPDAKVNGENTFYNILNVCFPFSEEKASMILFTLDIKGIALSRGSACQSGSPKPSHVLAEILGLDDIHKPSLRISFSHYNTKEEIDYLVEALASV